MRSRSIGPSSLSSSKRHFTGRRSERRTPSRGLPSCSCSQAPNTSSNSRSACVSVSTANAGSTRASTGRSRSSSAQKAWMVLMCASSKSCTAASSSRLASECGAGLRARALELFAQPQLQLAGGLLAERHRDDLADRGALVLDQRDDAADQLGGLAGAGRGLDDQRLVELAARSARDSRRRCARAASWRSRQLPQRVEVGEQLAASLRRVRRSSSRPHTTWKSHQSQAFGAGRAASRPCSIARSTIVEHFEAASSARRPSTGSRTAGSRRRVVQKNRRPEKTVSFGNSAFERQAVDHRLQHAAAVDDGLAVLVRFLPVL